MHFSILFATFYLKIALKIAWENIMGQDYFACREKYEKVTVNFFMF